MVLPKTLLANWQRELAKWAPSLRVHAIQGKYSWPGAEGPRPAPGKQGRTCARYATSVGWCF